jgi:hypothetical protein
VFQFESALCPNHFVYDRLDMGPVLRGDVLLEPKSAWRIRIGHKTPAGQLAHLLPIRAHAIDHIGRGRHQRAEALLALLQRLLSFQIGSAPLKAAIPLRNQAHAPTNDQKKRQNRSLRGVRKFELSDWREDPIVR